MRVDDLFVFIKERHNIYLKKEVGETKPWTSWPILQKFSFCNVYRENDRATKWIAKNWRKPNAKDPHLWFAMTVARFINWPDTLLELGYPQVGTKKEYTAFTKHFLSMVPRRAKLGQQVYGGAYTISTNGRKMLKHDYLMEQVFTPLWEGRGYIDEQMFGKKATLEAVHSDLMSFQGMGSFMAAQVIADFKYEQMKKAPDWWTFAASGPGSRRGLNRVCGLPKDKPWREEEWKATLDILHDRINAMTTEAEMPPIHAQDLQNCLCEFDKFERTRLGEGRPRSLYPGVV